MPPKFIVTQRSGFFSIHSQKEKPEPQMDADLRRFTQMLLGFVQGRNEAASYAFLAASFYLYQ